MAAYRIVQESLTNVLKHAAASRARIEVDRRADGLTIVVVDDGRGRSPLGAGQGHGLLGMRERVETYGGTFEAGSVEPHGFAVRVVLPLGAPA